MAKLELIQAANRAPVYALSGNNAQFSVPSAASTQKVAAPVRQEKTVGQALVDGEPGVALQVQGLFQLYLLVAVRAGHLST